MQDFKSTYDFCKLYKSKVGKRIIPNFKPSAGSKGKAGGKKEEAAVRYQDQPLKNLTFVLEGKVNRKKLEEEIPKLGGSISKKVTSTTAAVISTSGRRTRFHFEFYRAFLLDYI